MVTTTADTVSFSRFNPNTTDKSLAGFLAFHDGSHPMKALFRLEGNAACYVFNEDAVGVFRVTVIFISETGELTELELVIPDVVQDTFKDVESMAMLLGSTLPTKATLSQLALIGFNEF